MTSLKGCILSTSHTPQLGVEWPASECGGCQTSHDFYSVRSYRQSLGGNEHSSNLAFYKIGYNAR